MKLTSEIKKTIEIALHKQLNKHNKDILRYKEKRKGNLISTENRIAEIKYANNWLNLQVINK